MTVFGTILCLLTNARAVSAQEPGEPDSLIRRDLKAAESRFGPESPEAADAIDVLIESRCRREDAVLWTPGTLEIAGRAAAIRIRHTAPDSLDLARSLDNLGIVQWHHQKFAAAQATLERALALREKALDPDHPDVAAGRWHLGRVLLTRGDYSGARALFQRALEGYARRSAIGSEPAVQCQKDLGLTTERLAGPDSAGAVLDRALAVAESSLGPDHPAVADILLVLADMLDSREAAERALSIVERVYPTGHLRIAEARSVLGTIHRREYDYSAARPLLEESLARAEEILGTEHLLVARFSVKTGLLYYNVWSPKALPLFERALATQERLLGPDHLDVARTLRWIGADLSQTQTQCDPVRAEQCYLRSLRIQESTLPPDHPDIAAMLYLLSHVCLGQKEYDRGLSYAEKCVEAEERIYAPERSGYMAWRLETLAAAQDAVGEDSLAMVTMEKSQEFDLLDGERDYALLRSAADCFRHGGRLDRAYECALEGERSSRERFIATVRSLTEYEALRYTSYRADFLPPLLASVAEGLPSEGIRASWDGLIRGRTLVLDEMLARNRILRGSIDTEAARLIARADSARIHLAELVVRGAPGSGQDDHDAALADARSAKESAERALGNLGERFRQATLRDNAGYPDVASSLPPRCALVAYVRFLTWLRYAESVTRYLAFVLPGDGRPPVAVVLGEAATIDSLVAAWRHEVETGSTGFLRERGEESCRRAGEKLRRAVWDPVAACLNSPDGVFVVPDGALNSVNLNALPAGVDSFLVEAGPWIHTLPAEKDLVVYAHPDSEEGIRPDGGLLALGDPDYEARPVSDFAASRDMPATSPPAPDVARKGRRSACADMATIRFENLPASREEVRTIGDAWLRSTGRDSASVEKMVGRAATEGAFKEAAPGRSVVHLASHGFFFDGRCRADETIAGLGDFRRGFVTGDSLLDENPLLRSGLALAGANHHRQAAMDEEDGLLTAEEIGTLDLGSVRWAVLSACETGLGAIEGTEGVMGLSRAFQMAGVRSVIMSLWTIGDEPTRDWMAALYRSRFAQGGTTAESMRDASRRVLRNRRETGRSTHPFYWGAFVATGDWH